MLESKFFSSIHAISLLFRVGGRVGGRVAGGIENKAYSVQFQFQLHVGNELCKIKRLEKFNIDRRTGSGFSKSRLPIIETSQLTNFSNYDTATQQNQQQPAVISG